MTDNITIKKENIILAYRNGSDEQRAFLTTLFGEDIANEAKPKNIMERVRTFNDAYSIVAQQHSEGNALAGRLLADYQAVSSVAGCSPEIVAYSKLAIIACALNEGWQPQFTTDEYRHFPWFYLYTKEEIDALDEEEKSRVLGHSVCVASAHGGLAYSHSSNASSGSIFGSRLAFKTEELAVYAGKQFVDIWADFVFKVSEPSAL